MYALTGLIAEEYIAAREVVRPVWMIDRCLYERTFKKYV
jgi:hypothetical protein